jgi:anti-anti-sigma factor
VNVASRTLSDRRIVRVEGEIDLSTVGELRHALATGPDPPSTLVVDLRHVGFMDSMALGVILDASLRAAEQGHTLRVVCGPAAQRVIDAAGLGDRLALGDADDAA